VSERENVLSYLDRLADSYSAKAEAASTPTARMVLEGMALALFTAHDHILVGKHEAGK
jgi:hypothetical protein